MKASDGAELVGLAAVWGASFLFTRMGAGEFGPVALSALRVAGATALLLPWLALRGQTAALRTHWRPIFIVGLTNSALPFVCFGYAALTIPAGLSAIFNAATPLAAAAIAWWWLKDKLTPARIAGLALGFGGVLGLAWDKASFEPGGSALAIAGCLAATGFYGFAANYTKRRLTGVAPLAVAAGSQLAASLVLVLPAAALWPSRAPAPTAWLAATALALVCTGAAYALYFRLIARIGPANAIAVTFLVPLFAVAWGWLFLDEHLSPAMVFGGAVILTGTGLATGLLRPPRPRAAPVSAE